MEEQEEKRVRRAVQTTGLPSTSSELEHSQGEGEIDIHAKYISVYRIFVSRLFLKSPDIHFLPYNQLRGSGK